MVLPQRIKIQGKAHVLSVALILTKNEDGTPKMVRFIKPLEVVKLEGGEEFLTFYQPLTMTLGTIPPDGVPEGL